MKQYIILNNGILKLNSSVLPSSKGYISQYTPYGVYGLIVNEINEVIVSLMIVKMIYCQIYPFAFRSSGVYLTVYPSSRPNTNTVHYSTVYTVYCILYIVSFLTIEY